MIIVICNSYSKYHDYMKRTIAQSHAMSPNDFFHVCNKLDVDKIISLVANEIRIIEPITYLDQADWFNITRRIR